MQIKDILFPKTCLSCGMLGSYICLKCQKHLSFVKNTTCLYCGKTSLFGLTHPVCHRKYGIDGTLSIYHYNNTLKKIIKNIKYRLVRDAVNELMQTINTDIIFEKLGFFKRKTNLLISPIPIHPERLKKRGFNQAELLACFFSNLLKIPVFQALNKIKNTTPQANLKKKKLRYTNMLGAFDLIKQVSIRDKKILLIDDLITTGSTAKEAAKKLKNNGAERVYILALAQG